MVQVKRCRSGLIGMGLAGLLACGGSLTPTPTQAPSSPPASVATPTPEATPPGPTPTAAAPTAAPAVTWHRDVQPLVEAACAGCHTDGSIAPFALKTYTQAAPMAAALADATRAGRMPPWMPSDACTPIKDARVLTEAQKLVFEAWRDLGAPEGDPADAPPPKAPTGSLPWVDVSTKPTEAYTPAAELSDDYHCFVLDPQLDAKEHLIGYDIRPGADASVHHVLLYTATRAQAETKEGETEGVGWTCFGGPGAGDGTVVAGWVPGTMATRFPEGTGVALDAETVLIMQIHYNLLSGVREPDLTEVDLQLARDPVEEALIVSLANTDFEIPPNTFGYQVETRVTLPYGGYLWGMAPHMHQLGVQTGSDLVRNDNRTCVLDIPRWDFGWQQFYFFTEPVRLRIDDEAIMTCTWDNPTDRTVRWGEATTDEMCITYYYLTF